MSCESPWCHQHISFPSVLHADGPQFVVGLVSLPGLDPSLPFGDVSLPLAMPMCFPDLGGNAISVMSKEADGAVLEATSLPDSGS